MQPVPSHNKLVFYADKDCSVGAWRNVMIVFWAGQMRQEHFDAVRACNTQVLRSYPATAGINVFTPTFQLPDATARHEAEKLGRELMPRTIGAANVVEGDGMRVGTIRTVLSAILLTSRAKAPQRVFARLPDAAAWLSELPNVVAPGPNVPPALSDVVQAQRHQFP
jgi:hypothetical protein